MEVLIRIPPQLVIKYKNQMYAVDVSTSGKGRIGLNCELINFHFIKFRLAFVFLHHISS